MNDQVFGELLALYSDGSKHANYQNIPEFVTEATGLRVDLIPLWRDDKPRYEYIVTRVLTEQDQRICDIGANTGFFSLSLAKADRRRQIMAIEGNAKHSEMIRRVARMFELNRLEVRNFYLSLATDEQLPVGDLCLFLNVLHHIGFDFAKQVTCTEHFDTYAVELLSVLSRRYRRMVFQMGYNWGGDKTKPLIQVQDNIGKVRFTYSLLRDSNWRIVDLAWPELDETKERYHYTTLPLEWLVSGDKHDGGSLADHLSQHQNKSEFFSRPLFVCESDCSHGIDEK